MMIKVDICKPCAAKLKAILEERGEAAMAESLGETLCLSCLSKVPGYQPGLRLATRLKQGPLKPIGQA